MADLAGTTPGTGSVRYYCQDNIGSTRRLRDASKGSLGQNEYEPYGSVYSQSGASITRKFTGHDWDATAQLYFAPYRNYAPNLSRWLSRDPQGMLDGPNMYIYALDDPTGTTDPLGQYSAQIHGRYAFFDVFHNPFTHPRAHFRSPKSVGMKLDKAIDKCLMREFLDAMHMMQDVFSHYSPGWRWWLGGHIWVGKNPDRLGDENDEPGEMDRFMTMLATTDYYEVEWQRNCRDLPNYYAKTVQKPRPRPTGGWVVTEIWVVAGAVPGSNQALILTEWGYTRR